MTRKLVIKAYGDIKYTEQKRSQGKTFNVDHKISHACFNGLSHHLIIKEKCWSVLTLEELRVITPWALVCFEDREL